MHIYIYYFGLYKGEKLYIVIKPVSREISISASEVSRGTTGDQSKHGTLTIQYNFNAKYINTITLGMFCGAKYTHHNIHANYKTSLNYKNSKQNIQGKKILRLVLQSGSRGLDGGHLC